MAKKARGFIAGLMSLALAVGLVPAPAFAAGGEVASGLVASAVSLVPQALVEADYSWYSGHEEESGFSLAKPAQIVGFANLVNGTAPADVASAAVSFKGKAVSMTASMNLKGQEWVPIGDAKHPFQGSFEGNGNTVNNFKVSGDERSAYLGLFGYVGASGDVANVKVGSSASVVVTRAKASKDIVHHVAGVAGYCAGSMSGCTNNAKVTVTSAVTQRAKAPQVVYAVGGVAGECAGEMSACANSASAAVSVKVSSAAIASVDDSGLVRYVGGIAGVSGNSSRIGTMAAPIAADASSRASMNGCVNLAPVSVDTPSTAGKDRFGETAYSRSVCVGGIVGYAQGDVSECENGFIAGSYLNTKTASYGYVRAEHGTAVGGIAGSLRATPSTSNGGAERASGDDGSAGDDPASTAIELSRCTNYGDVYALNTVGGIVGSAGSYTTVSGCVNSKRASSTFVVATRWNKPAPAGIAGATNGDVAFCANFATVASGTWSDEANRRLKSGSGYYASGLVGMLSYFSKEGPSGSLERATPVPEVRASYSAGPIMAVSDMRQRGLVGDNGGNVHDNVLLKGVVEGDKFVYSDGAGGAEAGNVVLTAAELRGKGAVQKLNATCDSDGWASWWVPSDGESSGKAQVTAGYPLLAWDNPVAEQDREDLSAGWDVQLSDAEYTGARGVAAAVPQGVVSKGAETLVQGADFRVVPQSDAVAIGEGYLAEIRGIGGYAGVIEGAAYAIVKGDLSNCTVAVEPVTYDFEGHYPDKARISVKNAGGVEIDPDEYEIESVELRRGTTNVVVVGDYTPDAPPVDAGTYTVTVRTSSGSGHFKAGAEAEGSFRINPLDLQTGVSYDKVKISFQGKSYAWVSSGDEADPSKPATTLGYTGSPVKPTVSAITYKGHTLKNGTDYRIVYGNPNPVTTNGGNSVDANNKGTASGTAVGCVTVRYVSGGNFTSYQNMFFNITNGLASAKVTGLADKVYTGKALTQKPVVKVGSTTLKSGTHYSVSYKNNKAVGTATVVITGKAGTKYSGVKTATFKIAKKNPLTVKAKSPTVNYGKTTARTVAAKNVVTVSNAQGKVTYKKTSGSGNITMTSAGKLTVKKATKRGTYTIKVAVTAAGNKTYFAATKTASVKLKVK